MVTAVRALVLGALCVPFLAAGEAIAPGLVQSAQVQITQAVRYDPAYFVMGYPGGDVPADRGVCTDVVIRAYRAVGLDLQRLVHEDMKAHFSAYPKLWGLSRTDRNIDHRRVPNLQTLFRRYGASLPVTDTSDDYLPGDLVAWDLTGKGLWHIGIVVPPPGSTDMKSGSTWIVHNIGAGPQREDRLFEWKIIGHYRYGEGVPANHPAAVPAP